MVSSSGPRRLKHRNTSSNLVAMLIISILTKILFTIIMKTFSELQKDDKVYIIDSFGNLEITSITNILFSTNEEKVKVYLYNRGVFYFPYHSTQYSMYDSIVFSNKEEALTHLKGIKDWAENIIERTTKSITILTK